MLGLFESKLFWITAVLSIIYLYLKYYVFNYWKRHGVPHEQPTIPFGNINFGFFFGKISLGNLLKENYDKLKQYPFHGFYVLFQPVVIINDPELINTVLIKEFSRFHDRGWYFNEKVDPMSGHLFLLPGERWKKLRAKLSPTFTSGKLKQMYQYLTEVSNELIDTCEAETTTNGVIEVKDLIARYTTDIISSVVYGFKSNSLKQPSNEFRHFGIKALDFSKLSLILGVFIPDMLQKISIPLFTTDVRDFFFSILDSTISHRHKEKVVRKDFLNLLMQLMDHGEIENDEEKSSISNGNGHAKVGLEKLTFKEAAAQTFVFFLAGYETASSTATYCLYELALNPHVQDKLHKEIDQAEGPSGITYDSLIDMEYLDMVVSETLRKHPSVPILNRICDQDFQVPNSNYVIPKGMRIAISASGIHRNPEFFPDPDVFDPERFSKENQTTRSNRLNLGFGEGPRYCIGKRFGLLETKLAVVTMLRKYKFHVCEKTSIPVKYSTETFVQSPSGGIYLRAEKRKLQN